MATKFGTTDAFNSESDSIKAYLERVQLYFSANDVPENKHVSILLSSIGASTYALLSDLLAPQLPSAQTLPVISEVLCKHYEPKRAVITDRFHFHKRDQTEGESVTDYDDHLEDALRDRFVCGLQQETTQRRPLSEVDLTYSKAIEIARAIESADKGTKSFKYAEATIKKFISHTTQPKDTACYRCGCLGHTSSGCKFKTATCHACGRIGHIAPVCRSKSKAQARHQHVNEFPASTKQFHRTHQIQSRQSADHDSSEEEYRLNKVEEHSSTPLRVTVNVNGMRLPWKWTLGRQYLLSMMLPVRQCSQLYKYTDQISFSKLIERSKFH